MKKILFSNYRNRSKLLYEKLRRYSQGTPIVFKLKLHSEQAKLNDLAYQSFIHGELRQPSSAKDLLLEKKLSSHEEKVLKRYCCRFLWNRNSNNGGLYLLSYQK